MKRQTLTSASMSLIGGTLFSLIVSGLAQYAPPLLLWIVFGLFPVIWNWIAGMYFRSSTLSKAGWFLLATYICFFIAMKLDPRSADSNLWPAIPILAVIFSLPGSLGGAFCGGLFRKDSV